MRNRWYSSAAPMVIRPKAMTALPMLPQVKPITAVIPRARPPRIHLRTYLAPSTMPLARPTRPCISLGMMILVA